MFPCLFLLFVFQSFFQSDQFVALHQFTRPFDAAFQLILRHVGDNRIGSSCHRTGSLGICLRLFAGPDFIIASPKLDLKTLLQIPVGQVYKKN